MDGRSDGDDHGDRACDEDGTGSCLTSHGRFLLSGQMTALCFWAVYFGQVYGNMKGDRMSRDKRAIFVFHGVVLFLSLIVELLYI